MSLYAAIYARKSTDQSGVADEQKSVVRQVDHARAYAARKGWAVADAHVYVDDGISGAEFATRPGFVRLMNALKPKPPFQVFVMSEESRLGREAIETAFALKQIVQAGVHVFFYLEDHERTLDTPTDEIMLSLTAFADELEREKARQRVTDAMLRNAKAGHVTSGAVFGYDNVEVLGQRGARSHVERRIAADLAEVVRTLFEWYATGSGVPTIAKRLNEEGRVCPRAQRGRPTGWSPSSVWEVLHRPLYRGEIVWNRSKKRNKWGQVAPAARGEGEWLRIPAPHLRIVPEALWQAVQARAEGARAAYLKSTGGASWGRPVAASESKHLLVGFTRCASCGGSMVVRSRSHGQRRSYWYACSAFHRRGRAVCENSLEVRIERADDTILTDIEQFVLHPKVVRRAVALALEEFSGSTDQADRERDRICRELARVEAELANLIRVVAAGGDVPALVAAVREADRRRLELKDATESLRTAAAFTTATAAGYERQVLEKLGEWRAVLREAPQKARSILRLLFVDRLELKPTEADGGRLYAYRGRFTIGGLFEGLMCPHSLASPTGFEPVFWP